MKTLLIQFSFIAFLFATPLHAKECTQMEAYAAETVIDYLDSWEEIYNAYKSFGHCDDGAIAEGFDDVISIQWSDYWDNFPEMIKYMNENENFKTFIHKRIGAETISIDRWEKIVTKAKTSCPAGAIDFCREIKEVR